MSLKPICVPCHRFFRMIKAGFYFTEGMPKGSGAPPGTEAPEKWQPYKLWSGDKYRCEGCGAEVVVGVGQLPIAEHYQEGFTDQATRLGADKYQVNDC